MTKSRAETVQSVGFVEIIFSDLDARTDPHTGEWVVRLPAIDPPPSLRAALEDCQLSAHQVAEILGSVETLAIGNALTARMRRV